MLKRRLLLTFGVAALFLTAPPPAMADMFNFSFSGVQSNYIGGTFTISKVNTTTDGRVFRGVDNARFTAGSWGVGGDFSLSLTISGTDLSTRHGQGNFSIKDIDNPSNPDVIDGTIDGDWTRIGGSILFYGGSLSNVIYHNNNSDGKFDAHNGSLSMDSTAGYGAISIAPLLTTQWFDADWTTPVTTGSVDASVVPVPAAVLLGFLGLSAAGLGLRKLS